MTQVQDKTPSKCLGRLAPRSEPRTLMFRNYLTATTVDKPPEEVDFWEKRAKFPEGSWGNDMYGDCTMAKQAVMFMHFERLEQKRTINIPDQHVIDAYFNMTQALYGGGDTGAYEEDALNRSRNPETAIRDAKGRPLTISAYTRIDPKDLDAVRWAIALAAGKGIAFCIALPIAFQTLDPPLAWDIPPGQPLVNEWLPYSWGGHSMWATAYNRVGVWVPSTWNRPEQLITWPAWSAYVDEAHSVIDNHDEWRKPVHAIEVGGEYVGVDINKLVADVNAVSSHKIK